MSNCGSCANWRGGEAVMFKKLWRPCRGAPPAPERETQFERVRGVFPWMAIDDPGCAAFKAIPQVTRVEVIDVTVED